MKLHFFCCFCYLRREYNCHQCFYNTSCSRSFEFHLHGHLNKKRSALWNKQIATKFEEYSCRCGFVVRSSSVCIGNKIAEHLNHCEFKYCLYRSKQEEISDEKIRENSGKISHSYFTSITTFFRASIKI